MTTTVEQPADNDTLPAPAPRLTERLHAAYRAFRRPGGTYRDGVLMGVTIYPEIRAGILARATETSA